MHRVNTRMLFAVQTLLFFLLLQGTASAVETEPFTMERFTELQERGENILVHVSAPWCPNCRRQKEVLTTYQQQYPDSGLHILNVDFDTQKQWVTYFKAPQQSTLILFSGEERVWFSVAETRQEEIFEQLEAVRPD